ncbi:Enoyl-CoA hydratase/carnithine racemase [Streptomyces sp. DvalAA-14]|uniref:enoyl-CoA hydratase/isomerase family protein n=1 Tax=unclassified Streptomyces TaxID=2593676 RepID=UPI00081BC632|nr:MULTISPECIES: enoyl-CoA hydratase/isomerase family protein [unclassified Streptomyces]MYS22332.1 enoyl-CoA hydratase/isomerase family protein [Streptomyces sp. SID4948]SCE14141.1 Enoyl-CoA hydratase/carnithine racemase [Streptomyces sp. DvalAA-14]
MSFAYASIRTRQEAGVLFATLDADPLNLIGADLVRDLVSLVDTLYNDPGDVRVVVIDSASAEFFSAHVDLTAVPQYTAEAARAGGPGDASLGMFLHKLARVPVITVAKVRGRARGGGNELALACDMIFASREKAVVGQFEAGTGALPGAGGIQHLTRRLGRTRAIEAVVGADDFDADLAERYGWINRSLPDAELDGFVDRLARRIAGFPPEGVKAAKRAINDLTLAGPANIRSDAATFQALIALPETRERLNYLTERGLQTPGGTEHDLGKAVAEFPG